MYLNLTVLAGRLAATPEFKTFESGSILVRCLVTVRTEEPRRRIDVIPVVMWNPSEAQTEELRDAERGETVWVAGSTQRRFWPQGEGRSSSTEIVAHEMRIKKEVSA